MAEYGRLRQWLSAGLSALRFPHVCCARNRSDGWDMQIGVPVLRASYRRRTLLAGSCWVVVLRQTRARCWAQDGGRPGEASAPDELGFLALGTAVVGHVSGNLSWEDCSCAAVGVEGQLVKPGEIHGGCSVA